MPWATVPAYHSVSVTSVSPIKLHPTTMVLRNEVVRVSSVKVQSLHLMSREGYLSSSSRQSPALLASADFRHSRVLQTLCDFVHIADLSSDTRWKVNQAHISPLTDYPNIHFLASRTKNHGAKKSVEGASIMFTCHHVENASGSYQHSQNTLCSHHLNGSGVVDVPDDQEG